MSFFGSRIRSTWVRLVFSIMASLFLEIFCFFMASASCIAKKERDDFFHRLRLQLSKDAFLFEEVVKSGAHMFARRVVHVRLSHAYFSLSLNRGLLRLLVSER